MEARERLQQQWTHLYKHHLPALAKARDPVQKHWPVFLDHCFARIVLDNAVGVDKPWAEVVKQPAVKHMSVSQLEEAMKLAESIATGDADLVKLDERSLQLRRKKQKRKTDPDEGAHGSPKKRKQDTAIISSYFLPSPASPQKDGSDQPSKGVDEAMPKTKEYAKPSATTEDMAAQLRRIKESNLTSFRKQMLNLLCQIPRGRYSTYQAISNYITKTSHKTCARAVGNAMRNNPFAPEVPCHRVLAADGTLGGFGGHWGENGKFASRKHRILHEEGVRFDSRGKVKGPPFQEFYG